ncbi:P-loop containing nucleoside triphosphate hydrolase [Glarea lozoyensis ATCC 20868]|uniref:p-loop containing nucleoside triphosphate hydrolase n=2 Tax=Glarea lozoyensis TaxID=101852 RepID=S3CJS6_GLAL2|nr:P-loop containing nucleoside triphosphate hydrolase [Glarea lozoyensis ATCC 20868]EPE26055.1 P-loop containing nucleoside triphosphate hydrolase [Glarea lozoyensis ATCC 20868]
MSFAEPEGRPAKKRRFFEEKSNLLDASLTSSASLPDEIDAFPGTSSTDAYDGNQYSIKKEDPESLDSFQDDFTRDIKPLSGFDKQTFESFIGDKVSSDILGRLREACGSDIERAVNMYFDGSWRNFKKEKIGNSSSTGVMSVNAFTKSLPIVEKNNTATKRSETEVFADITPALRDSMPEHRYIGAFGVGGWATTSGTNLIKHGEVVRIDRQKIQPMRTPISKGRGRTAVNQPPPKANTAAGKRVDVIVRFTNSKGSEIGRLPRETANWVSTLMDQKVCRFEGTCVYAPERIRTNDTIFLQLRCSLLRTAFDNAGFSMPDNRATGMFEEKETSEEKELRLRQVALVKLFDEVNLLPSKTSATTAKHKREGLLQAAEVAEQYERSKAKDVKVESKEVVSLSPPSEEAEDGKELEQDQLDALYKKAQSFDFNAPAAEPAATFAMDLRQYQKQALHWMMSKEKDEKNSDREVSMHPLWEEYAWPIRDMDDKDLPGVRGQDSLYVNPYSGELSLRFPVQEQNCLGGILADEMGLGKTIEMMSLIHSHKSDVWQNMVNPTAVTASVNNLPRLPVNSGNVESAPCTTLVVAPMSLLAQWQSEAENASKDGTLKSMVYYGNEKNADLQALCCEKNAASAPNVIITSYGVILSEFNKVAANGGNRAAHGGLFSLKYFRVILDEAHHIKNRQSKTARACYEIDAEHRWVLTGTPIVNRLEDLFSLVRFLRVEPWSNFSFWKTFITVPFESKDFMRALDVVQTVLEPLVLRRTKDMKTPAGEALVPLPLKTINIVDIELSQPEREVYDHIFTRAKRNLAANMEAGTVMKAYTSIFAQILRLRQSCCHPILTRNQNLVADEEDAAVVADAASGMADDMDLQSLIERFTAETDDSADANAFGAHVLEQIRDEAENECPICAEEPMIEQTVTGCWHSACKKCLLDYINHQTDKNEIPRCFSCCEVLNTRDIFEVVRDDGHPDSKITLQRLGSNSSAKVGALLTSLKTLRNEKPRTKTVVFSQFTSFLSLIEPALTRAAIPFLRLDGTMAQKARTAVLKDFSASKKGVVLLLSLRAGGVGLNLTMAKRVYMMDPWWSFAVEAQAIDRVHRMGQTDEVLVSRFIVKDSIEEKMLKIQDRKKFIASSLGMMSDEEKKLQRIEDIKELLS